MPGGGGLDHLAAVLPDPVGGVGAASDHVDEADHPLRLGGGGGVERGAVGQGGAGEAAAHQPGCGPTPRWCRPTSPTRPTRVCWPRRSAGSRRPVGGSRPPVARPAPRCGTGPGRPGSGRIRSARSCGLRSAAGKDEAQAAVRRVTGELADLAETAAKDAERLLANAKRALRTGPCQGRGRKRARGEHDPAAGPAPRTAGPRRQRPDRAAGRDPPDRRADPSADGRC